MTGRDWFFTVLTVLGELSFMLTTMLIWRSARKVRAHNTPIRSARKVRAVRHVNQALLLANAVCPVCGERMDDLSAHRLLSHRERPVTLDDLWL
jgi:hypothetical protein